MFLDNTNAKQLMRPGICSIWDISLHCRERCPNRSRLPKYEMHPPALAGCIFSMLRSNHLDTRAFILLLGANKHQNDFITWKNHGFWWSSNLLLCFKKWCVWWKTAGNETAPLSRRNTDSYWYISDSKGFICKKTHHLPWIICLLLQTLIKKLFYNG